MEAVKREIQKDVELAGRKWRITKFDALTGSFIATKIMGKVGAVLASVATGQATNEAAIATAMSEALSSMSKAEFIEIQLDALSVVGEIVMAGNTETLVPVKIANGAWGVAGLEHDLITVMSLVVHSLVFNISPFFDGDALKPAIESFKDLNLLNAST